MFKGVLSEQGLVFKIFGLWVLQGPYFKFSRFYVGDIEAFYQGFHGFLNVITRIIVRIIDVHKIFQAHGKGLAGLASRAEDFQELPMSLN